MKPMFSYLTKTVITFIVAFLLLFVANGQNAYKEKEKEVKKLIEKLNKDMEKAFNDNDMQKVAAFYSDDSEIVGEGYAVKGRKDLDAYWLSLKDKGRGWKLEVNEIGGTGEYVYQLGRSDLNYMQNGKLTNSATNFIVIWKMQPDGSYKIFRDYITDMLFTRPAK